MNRCRLSLKSRQTACLFALLCSLSGIGCNSLQSGDLHVLQQETQENASNVPIILIRGWRDLWSDGIDRLAEELRAQGFRAEVFKESQAKEVGDILLTRCKAHELHGPIVLIGFSYGADDVIDISRRLAAENRAVQLLVLIDPVTPGYIPFVRRCVNFYQPNGFWDVFPWLRGVPVEHKGLQAGSSPASLENVNVREREDLNTADMSHKTIAENEKIRAAIVHEVKDAMRAPF